MEYKISYEIQAKLELRDTIEYYLGFSERTAIKFVEEIEKCEKSNEKFSKISN